jgi:hypothetical protein
MNEEMEFALKKDKKLNSNKFKFKVRRAGFEPASCGSRAVHITAQLIPPL